MKTNLAFIVVIWQLLGAISALAQTNSVLSNGQWFKLGVEEAGIYKLDRDFISNLGIDPSNVDPRRIAVYGYGGGMLPQENSASRFEDLPEMAIYASGDSDGSLDDQDYFLFYAASPDYLRYEPSGELGYEKNLYADVTYYFLTVQDQPGKRLISQSNEGLDHPLISSYQSYYVNEVDRANLLGSGREWYGQILTGSSADYEIEIPSEGLVPSSEIRITSAVMAQSFQTSSFDVKVNGAVIGNQVMGPIPDAVYDIKGVDQEDQFIIPADAGNSGPIVTLSYTFNAASSGTSIGYHNYSIVEMDKNLVLSADQMAFRSLASVANQFSTFQVGNADSQTMVWDITDPQNVLIQESTLDGNTLLFGTFTSSVLKEFIAIRGEDFPNPDFSEPIDNQNIRGVSSVDGLIITHASFLSEANRLAAFRSSNDGLDVAVVTVDQVYNEFSSGRQDISAVRDYIKHLYDRDAKLKYVLLFGDASYDYKDRTIGDNTNYVPIYEARNSLHPIFSYSSDDYFGFMDADEGFWEETQQGDHLLDVGIGRLPVKTMEEAQSIVDKLITYEDVSIGLGDWRNEVYFVADDGDFNIHQRDADELASLVDDNYSAFNPNKIYLDAFQQVPTADGGQTAEDVTQAINEAIDQGSLIFNFTGHGNENLWCQEEILDQSHIQEWTNLDRLPLFVTATCEFGRYDNPALVSGGELLILSEKGGAMGLLTTSRPVFSNTNFLLNQAFYNNVFEKNEDGEFPRLGDIIRKTKNGSLRGPVNRNFALLGDPMARLAYPGFQLEIDEINGAPLTLEGDTIRALGLTRFKGQVINQAGIRQQDFNGTLSVKVFDVPAEFVTLGNESNPTIFEQRNSLIFKGEATVQNGDFEFAFVVPKNITYLFENAKISMYASSEDGLDANGSNINLKLGGTDPNAPTDNIGPELDLFLNDESFRSGDKTSANPLFLANVFDQNGINISDAGVGQQITLTLDNSTTYNLNEFYTAALDSYQSGAVRFPLSDLEEGKHTLTLKVFDTYNNSSTKTIDFFVSKDAKSAISDVTSYPNPFNGRTTFVISHDRIGENLEVIVEIYSLSGDLIQTLNAELFDNTGTIEEIEWDRRSWNGARVKEGIYVSKIILLTNDGPSLSHHKLIVID